MSNEGQQSRTARRGRRIGVVSSAGGDKTVRVIVNTVVRHPVYGKYIRRRSKLAVHDPQNAAHPGDRVEIVPCRRISKQKSWRLVRIVRRGSGEEAPADKGESK